MTPPVFGVLTVDSQHWPLQPWTYVARVETIGDWRPPRCHNPRYSTQTLERPRQLGRSDADQLWQVIEVSVPRMQRQVVLQD